MRGAARRYREEEEEESAFVSMTDMTVSFLFIVILLLAFFASKFTSDDLVPRMMLDRAVSERDEARQERDAVLRERDALQEALKATREELAEVSEQLASAKMEIASLSQTNEDQRQRILQLEARIEEFEARNFALREEITKLERRIAELEALLRQENPLEEYGARSAQLRREMLERLALAVQEDITEQQIEGLTVTAQGDALRFQGSGLFASGARTLTGSSLEVVRLLGQHLDRELPCYSVGPRSEISMSCNPDLVLFETIQIEGHTDSQGGDTYNLELAADRALSAFKAIAPDRDGEGSEMLSYENLLGQPLLAFAGYGEMRPIVDETTGDKSANRRIDLRFIMYVPPGVEFIPETVDDLDRISARLRERAAER